jgi:hypothetical protein
MVLIGGTSVVELTTEDVNSALDVDIGPVTSVRRNGVKKGFLLLSSQSKIVESLQINGKDLSHGAEVGLFPHCKNFCTGCRIC